MEKKSKAKYSKVYGIFCLLSGDNHDLTARQFRQREREREIIKRPHTARSFVTSLQKMLQCDRGIQVFERMPGTEKWRQLMIFDNIQSLHISLLGFLRVLVPS